MTVLYLDTEFNGWQGQLISLALFNPADPVKSFYEVLGPLPKDPTTWVAEHVLPVLDRMPTQAHVFRARLRDYLKRVAEEAPLTVVADWPADVEHLMYWMAIEGAPWKLNVEMTILLVDSGELKSVRPHNALSDARALWEWHRKTGYTL